jgi:hypothetical protein
MNSLLATLRLIAGNSYAVHHTNSAQKHPCIDTGQREAIDLCVQRARGLTGTNGIDIGHI